ncbi:WhiB family transcriptional regulator [Bifidobacterium biavatii]|uniref:WhiB family transcriptional regulator n=1 Tax=Bifidobacterium biavatii DSM 23969 TaxID=1437608 RepID=A0A086ZD91_9BIFI|nr:WhiB family transcriptional regulator [Bifidobacterium biavatii]KFI44491.1 WhiB family transcriptional regulator [Bifidobacterium biavatii DSM 23969]
MGIKRASCAELEKRNPHIADVLWHQAEEGGRRSPKAVDLAIMICMSCPLRMECLADSIANVFDDESIYGGMGRRERQTIAGIMENDGVHARRRDGVDPDKRRLAALEWLRAHRPIVDQVTSMRREYWREDYRKRKARARQAEPVSA